MADSLFRSLLQYGPWGVVLAVVVAIMRLLITKGYGVKTEIGPRRKT